MTIDNQPDTRMSMDLSDLGVAGMDIVQLLTPAGERRGDVRYDAWVWHAGRRRASALWWEETRRVLELFRDLAASWFWVGPPPVVSAARTNGGSSRATPDGRGAEVSARA